MATAATPGGEDQDEVPEWATPDNLLNKIEKEVRSIYPFEDGGDPIDTAELLLCILIPLLRESLRCAGLSIPAYGPYSSHRELLVREEAARKAEVKDLCETPLYRWHDAAELLLYVGISGNLGERTKGHVKGSSWMEFVSSSRVERFPSRSQALEAERAAIKAERPLFNYQHNNTPEAKMRLVEYLVAHGRLDLLAPAVSRG